ncbi:MAG: hypothetical protein DWQ47_09895 [Acidobacteria bacterium]|nr:MAG: hypothetical protein DWQ32_12310 [Acidobacteriota bacterium]REJ98698.1 MAG: hypothetical protein DWQ38_15170 [Acidobacteriota bacterium]REK16647.1 MAG: hypothetical protein DWQ43_00155 [Acidobacteriota bacterium]REK42558.1 MAG: hypothetical protein DWQ47_09895 [Acidobacteriota bacterium]
MSIAYQCPSCLKPLEYRPGDPTFQTCYHCKGKIMVPSDTVHQAEMIDADPTEYSLKEQRDLRLAEIQKELQAGNKINAIAMFRETFGTGLADAKDAVDAMQRGRKPDVSRSALQQNYQALQEQQPQSIYPDAKAEAQNPGRMALVIVAALIAMGIAIAVMVLGE